MKYACLAAVAALMFACPLFSQASAPVSGNVNDDEADLVAFNVDFGGTAQSITISLSVAANSGSSGLDASLVDMDELAANGTVNAIDAGFDSGMGTINLSLTTPMYTGVHLFALQISTDSANGPSGYSGTLSSPALNAGDIVQSDSTTLPDAPGYYDLLGRGGRYGVQSSGANTLSRDVDVDFGPTPQAITFFIQGVSFVADNDVEVYEVTAGGTESLIGTLTLNAGNGYGAEGNFTTTMRSGTVTLRVKIVSTAADAHIWQLVLPGTATSIAPSGGGGGGGGGNGGGCSTSHTQSWWTLLSVLAGLVLAARLAGSRA